MDEKSTHLKKCASLNNLIQNNQSMNVAQSQSSPAQRDHLTLSLYTPRTRRFSCSSNGNGSNSGLISPGPPRLAPRVSQLRQEECAESQNVREVNHEREVHMRDKISQSYEDLTLVMNENWSFKSNDEFSNPLHVSLPNNNSCSSLSPTSRQSVMRICSGMSPSPTRRSFATRRSMSPIAIRPSPLGSVKRKFDMVDDGNSCSSSSQPYKKFFTESYSRGSSPIMSPLPICPSPDSSTNNSEFSGRITPKMFVTKAFSSTFSSMTSSPLSTHSFENDSPSPSALSNPSSSSSSSSSKEQERMEVASTISTDADSGVDANSDVGCELTSNEVVQSDSVRKDSDSKERDEMIIEEEIAPSNIPMTL